MRRLLTGILLSSLFSTSAHALTAFFGTPYHIVYVDVEQKLVKVDIVEMYRHPLEKIRSITSAAADSLRSLSAKDPVTARLLADSNIEAGKALHAIFKRTQKEIDIDRIEDLAKLTEDTAAAVKFNAPIEAKMIAVRTMIDLLAPIASPVKK
jgi:hypothetical protein